MKVGLVLSGGMGKGAYQIGTLKAISSYFRYDDFCCVSCSSVGVLNGYAFLTGNLTKAEDIWLNICSGENRLFINRIVNSHILQEVIDELVCSNQPLSSTCYCSLLDITAKTLIYKDISSVPHTQLSDYLNASVAIPYFQKGVTIDKHRYYDGAFVDNIPVYPLINQHLDFIICIYFDNIGYRFENNRFDSKIIKICFPSQKGIKESLVLRNERTAKMIKDGYDYTAFLLDSIFSKGKDDLETIYQNIRISNMLKGKLLSRITADILASNLNKVTQKLTNKEIT